MAAFWDELYVYFARGDPPLALQLLALNSIVLIILMIRRMRGAPALRSDTYRLVQALLIFATTLVVFEVEIADFFGYAV
jgi:hypothetical protein